MEADMKLQILLVKLFAVIGTTAAFADRADAIERLGNKLSTGLLWGVVFFVGLMLWGWLRK